jgi:two-component system cell cycle sensor histidine kinase/response regulator CckA
MAANLSPDFELAQPSERRANILGVLSRAATVGARPVTEILRSVTETAAATLQVARVNVWLYDSRRTGLTCIESFDLRTGRHESGEVLRVSEHPNYFHALDMLRSVSAMVADEDPRTSELDAYLARHGITTILDVPMLRAGEVFGVVCHEHAGSPRSFSESDRLFAGSIGDLVALVLETAQGMELQEEQARMRESVARMAQIQSLGWLAAGVAHDFRNVLSVVFTSAEQLLRTPELDADSREAASAILEAGVEARDLCQQLQAYAGKSASTVELRKLDEVLADTFRAFRSRVPASVRFQTQVGQPISPTWLDVSAIRRAVMNLLVNALEALPASGGNIDVCVRQGEPSSIDLEHGYDFRPGPLPCVSVEVSDSGSGIEEDLLLRVYEPFFTTKSRGSGLGLATVLGAMRAQQGAISVDSVRGRGTRIRLWLPLASGEDLQAMRLQVPLPSDGTPP